MRKLMAAMAILVLPGCDGEARKKEMAQNDAIKKDMSQLEGEWFIVAGEVGGQAFPQEDNHSKMIIKEGKTMMTLGSVVLY